MIKYFYLTCCIFITNIYAQSNVLENGKYMYGIVICDKGYKKIGEKCNKILIPEYGMLNGSGNDWVCQKGYRNVDGKCIKIDIPANATLNYFGSDWICDKGFKKNQIKCDKVVIPENGILNTQGNDWVCQKGYRNLDDKCIKIQIPENAALNYFGNEWICNKGYKRKDEKCDKVLVPENGILNSSGNDWLCNEGYKKLNDNCIKMTADEVIEYERIKKYLAVQAAQNIDKDCKNEYKTNADVCVQVLDTTLDCHENFDGDSYRDCEVSLEYQIKTNYEGGTYIDTDIECTVEIEYKKYDTSFSYNGSDEQVETASHNIYAYRSIDNTIDFSFSFSGFEKISSVKVSASKCNIEKVNLY